MAQGSRFPRPVVPHDDLARLAVGPAARRAVARGRLSTNPYDARNDGDLQNQIRDHYWAEVDTGGGFQAADPSAGTVGATLTAVLDTFTDIPANLRHRVTLTLDAEIYSQAGAVLSRAA